MTFRKTALSVSLAACTLIGIALTASPAEAMNGVQYVQQSAKVGLRGNAYQWWDNAAGKFQRSSHPGNGAVLVFSKTRHLPFGHVAVVNSIKNNRTILIDHANWSPVRGRRGQVERAVTVVDVSPKNDWSQVRVWYGPTADIGNTVYPVKGFIHPTPFHQHSR